MNVMSYGNPSFKGRELIKGQDTSFGIFYPTGYVVASLESYQDALRAKETLLSAGYSEDEVDAVPPEYVVSDIENGTDHAGFLTRVGQAISGAIGTEAGMWEDDLKLARQGAGFLLIHCPTAHEAKRVRRLLKSENLTTMRRYTRAAIEKIS